MKEGFGEMGRVAAVWGGWIGESELGRQSKRARIGGNRTTNGEEEVGCFPGKTKGGGKKRTRERGRGGGRRMVDEGALGSVASAKASCLSESQIPIGSTREAKREEKEKKRGIMGEKRRRRKRER